MGVTGRSCKSHRDIVEVQPVLLPRNDESPQWYAVHTACNHEQRAATHLEHLVEYFLPTYHVRSRWKDRVKTLERPLFPGYLFVHATLRDRTRILQAPGVVTLVGRGSMPVAVPSAEIEALRNARRQRHPAEPYEYLKAGQLVEITAGVFAGLTGFLLRKENGTRVVISLETIMRSFVVTVDGCDIRPIARRVTA